LVAKNSNQKKSARPRRKSRRERMTKVIIYIMIFGMLLTAFTYGLSAFI